MHVSVVNWIKAAQEDPKKLSWQEGDARDSPWSEVLLDRVPASLSASLDVTSAASLAANADAGGCYQGQTHGHEGFLLSPDEAHAMCAAQSKNAEVIFPYLIGEDLLNEPGGQPTRWLIDFGARAELEARRYSRPWKRVEELVLPDRERAAAEEQTRNARLGKAGNRHHESFLRRWWQLSYARGALLARLGTISRYIACSLGVTKRPIFAFVSTAIHPGDALTVSPSMEDDYSFGILQSGACTGGGSRPDAPR